jgi:phage-related minor tail protein
MANDIKGINVKIGGDTTNLKKALGDTDAATKSLQKELREVNRQLKFDPSNTMLLTQKHTLLGKEIENTKERLTTLKAAQDQFDESAKGTEEGAAQYRALEREIEKTESQLQNMQKEYVKTSETSQKLYAISDNLDKISKKADAAGTALTKGLTVPIAALGAASMAAWNELDEAMDTVVKKTGATGATLTDLQDRAKSIAETIPVSFQSAADAVGEVNTRFGLTGQACEDLAKQFVEFAELNNSDVSSSVDGVQKALTAFGESSDHAGQLLDVLNRTAQNTGISVETLESGVVSNAAAFQEMGLTLNQSVSFMGQLEKSGADSSTVMSGLRKALKNAAKDGVPLNDELANLQETIENGTGSTSGLTEAYDLFGKSGDAVYQAVKNGSIDFRNLASETDILADSTNSVSDTFDATLDPVDELKVTLNNLKDTGAELATNAMQLLAPAFKKLTETVKDAKKKWDSLSDSQKDAILKLAGLAAVLGPSLKAFAGLTKVVKGAVDGINKFQQQVALAKEGIGPLSGAIAAMTGPAGLALAACAGLAAGIGAIMVAAKDTADSVTPIGSEFESLADTAESSTGKLKDATQSLDDAMGSAGQTMDKVEAQKDVASELVGELEELNSKSSLTKDQQLQMASAVERLNGLYPGLNLEIDRNTGHLNQNNQELEANVNNLQKQAEKAAATKVINDIMEKQADVIAAANDAMLDAKVAQDNYDDSLNETEGAASQYNETQKYMAQLQSDIANGVGDVTAKTNELNDAQGKIDEGLMLYNGSWVERDQLLGKVGDNYDKNTRLQKDYADAQDEANQKIDEANQRIEALNEIYGLDIPLMDGVSDSLSGMSDAYGEASGSADAYSGAADNIAASTDSQVQSLDELKQAALDDLNTATDMFKKYKSDSKVTLQSMDDALKSQAKAFGNYASNVNTITSDSRYQTDENFRAMADSIMNMGIDGADYLQRFTNAAQSNDGQLAEILNDYGSAQEAKDQYATAIAQMQQATQDGTDAMVGEVAGAQGPMANAAGNTAQAGADAANAKSGAFGSAGQNAGNSYANGINATRGFAQASGSASASALVNGLSGAINQSGNVGRSTGANYANGVGSQAGNSKNAGDSLGSNAAAGANKSGEMRQSGSDMGNSFASGLRAAAGAVESAAQWVAGRVAAFLHHSTPDEGPLHGDDLWGYEFSENFAEGIRSNIGKVRKASEELAASATIPDIEPKIRLVADDDGTRANLLQAASAAGKTTVNQIYIDGIKYNTDSYIDASIDNFVKEMLRKGQMYGGN